MLKREKMTAILVRSSRNKRRANHTLRAFLQLYLEVIKDNSFFYFEDDFCVFYLCSSIEKNIATSLFVKIFHVTASRFTSLVTLSQNSNRTRLHKVPFLFVFTAYCRISYTFQLFISLYLLSNNF